MAPASPMITVSKRAFTLTLWKIRKSRYVVARRFKIAVGMVGHETPVGMYLAEGKTKTPDWRAPDSDWVQPLDRGKVFKFDDPRNPFAGGFISISQREGVGIHGTKFEPKLGQKVSHGCIRMAVPDFEQLYPLVPEGTPVFVY